MSRSLRRAILAFSPLAFGLVLVAPPARPAAAVPPPGAATPAAERPAGSDLVARALERAGGREAWMQVADKGFRIVIEAVAGPRPLEMRFAGIGFDRLKVVQPIPQLGMEIVMGLDGEVAWADVPIQGRQRVDPVDLAAATDLVRMLLLPLEVAEHWTAGTVTESRFADRPTWAVTLTEKLPPAPEPPAEKDASAAAGPGGQGGGAGRAGRGGPPTGPVEPRSGIAHVDRETGELVAVAWPTSGRARQGRTITVEAWGETAGLRHPLRLREEGGRAPRSITVQSFAIEAVDAAEIALPEDLRDPAGDQRDPAGDQRDPAGKSDPPAAGAGNPGGEGGE